MIAVDIPCRLAVYDQYLYNTLSPEDYKAVYPTSIHSRVDGGKLLGCTHSLREARLPCPGTAKSFYHQEQERQVKSLAQGHKDRDRRSNPLTEKHIVQLSSMCS